MSAAPMTEVSDAFSAQGGEIGYPPIDDDYEAGIRQMPLEAWLKWKRDSGYTYDLLSL